MAHVKKFCRRLPVVLLLFILVAGLALAQEDPELRITDIDLSNFPTVGVRLLTRDASSAPVADLSGLVLRENRAPIPEFELARVPTGIDLVYVIDANDTILQIDDNDGLTRRDKVAASVEQYARQFMNPAGLDRVTVIVPDETGTGVTVLAEDISSPPELAAAVAAYQPVAPPRVTPLNDMMTAALDHLGARRDDGRFQTVLLFSDGGRLDQQLAYQDLSLAAQEAGVPLFGAILGATADENEVAGMQRLADPTRGQVVHMPEPTATDAFYRLFQSQSTQTEARYQSLVRRSGGVDISAALGNIRTESAFTLDLAEPLLTLDIPEPALRRVGSAIDTPLPLLQPAVYPLTATITWPDGIRRELTEFAFLVDGRRQPLPNLPAPDADGVIPLAWDVSNTEAGAYTLQVQARDMLGYEMSSVPQTVTVTIERPQPPTPTPVPTAVPMPSLTLPGGLTADDPIAWLLPVLFALAVLGGLATLWAVRRRRARQRAAADEAAANNAAPPLPADPPEDSNHIPTLERLAADGSAVSRTTLTERDTLIGRDPDYATLVVDDPTVARLHARLRQTEAAELWLYDEGSTTGTFLNHTRLGLAPRPVQHGDHLQFGRAAFRFTLQRPTPPTPAVDPGPAIDAPTTEPDEAPTGPTDTAQADEPNEIASAPSEATPTARPLPPTDDLLNSDPLKTVPLDTDPLVSAPATTDPPNPIEDDKGEETL